MGEPVIELRDVHVVRDGRPILRGIDWDVGADEHWAVLGPNGSGKTTLLRVAAMRLLPTRGQVRVLGHGYVGTDVRALRRRVAFVSGAVLRSFRSTITAHDIVLTGLHAALEPWWHTYGEDDHRRADTLLRDAGLAEVSDRTFDVLSEGERQRVLLARALMASPDLMLFDEPAAGLDLGALEQLVQRLGALVADETSPPVVLVTHHLEEIPPGITHAVLLRDGAVVASGPVDEVVTSAQVSACFGVDVVVTHLGGRITARADVGGDQPKSA
ncbi:MAG TPA: ATP-binding cassette domain-containing protein [Acidimicrobiales bacterium]|nr:ATP-binding cassette domain-containing protein [Acidimicrobiales bacterium]